MDKLIVDVANDELDSAFVEDLPYYALEKLFSNRFEPISLQDNALLRTRLGPYQLVSEKGNFVKEGAVYVPGRGAFLVRSSPIFEDLKRYGGMNYESLRGKDDHKLIREALEDAVEIPNSEHEKVFPTFLLEKDKLMQFIFGDVAKDYGKFLYDRGIRELKIKTLPMNVVNGHYHPFVRDVYFGSLGESSVVDATRTFPHKKPRAFRGLKRKQR
jgi:hypothetical protein